MPTLRPTLCVLIALGSCCIPGFAPAQQITGQNQSTLLTSAQQRYYNLRSSGLKSFSCAVDIDWDALFISVSGKPLDTVSPFGQFLLASRLTFTNSLDGKPEVVWAPEPKPSPDFEKRAEQLRGGYLKMLVGFFQSWNPSLDGNMFPKMNAEGVTVVKSPKGYLIEQIAGKETSAITMDNDLRIEHLSVTTEEIHSEVDLQYKASPQGLLLTNMDSTYSQPPTAPSTHIMMEATFQPLSDLQIPASLDVVMPNVATFKMKFTACTVQKQK